MLLLLAGGGGLVAFRKWFPRGAATYFVVLIAIVAWARQGGRAGVIDGMLGLTEMLIFGGAVAAAFGLPVRVHALPVTERRRSLLGCRTGLHRDVRVDGRIPGCRLGQGG